MEKWLKSRPNPYVNNKIGFKGSKTRFGKPAQLFKESDRDGVANVFDCKPYNKRKQDVIMPFSGSNPMQEMHQRQESSRLNALYQRQVAALQKQLEDEKVKTAAWSSDSWDWSGTPYMGGGIGEFAGSTQKTTKTNPPLSSGGSSLNLVPGGMSKTGSGTGSGALNLSYPSSTSKPSSSSSGGTSKVTGSVITGKVISAPSKSTASSPYAYINVPGGQSRAASPISSSKSSSSSAKGSGGSRK